MTHTIRTLIAYAMLVMTTFSTSAQVTIGSTEKPVQGALLDLKENDGTGANSTKGLLLPRVNLSDLTKLTIAPEDQKAEHTGTVIYGISSEEPEKPEENSDPCISIPIVEGGGASGIMVWTGEEWMSLLPKEGETTTDSDLPSWVHPAVKLTKPDHEGNNYTYRYFGDPDHQDITLEEFVAAGGIAADYKNFGYWMTENLRSKKYASNHPDVELSLVQAGNQTKSLVYGYPRKFVATNAPRPDVDMQIDKDFKEYPSMGLLYSGGAIAGAINGTITVTPNMQGICPDGWFLPTRSDWNGIVAYLNTPEQRALYTTYDTHPVAVDPNPSRTLVTACNIFMDPDAVISARGKLAREGAFGLVAVGWGNVTSGVIFNNKIFEYPETVDTGSSGGVNVRAGAAGNPPNNTVYYNFTSLGPPLVNQMITVRCRTNVNPEP